MKKVYCDKQPELRRGDVVAPRRLLRSQEAAEYLNVAEKTLRAWRSNRSGGITKDARGPPYISLPGIRYMQSDLDEYIEARRRTSTSDDGRG